MVRRTRRLVEEVARLFRRPSDHPRRVRRCRSTRKGWRSSSPTCSERDIRIMGVEGTKASWLGLGMPPLVSGSSRTTSVARPARIPPVAAKVLPSAKDPPRAKAADSEAAERETPAAMPAPEPQHARAASLVHDKPVRSGQSVIFPDGDVTILGSVASGSEVVAGGSIHIYGTLRGRAIAGSTGNSGGAHLLQQARGGAHRHRRPLSHGRRDGSAISQPAGAGLARRRDDDDGGAELSDRGG